MRSPDHAAFSRPFDLLLAALCTATVTAQQTWVVAPQPAPGVDFTDIPPAIAAAAPGDRVEVLGTSMSVPTFSSFVVDKELDVEALEGALVRWFRVEGLPAGATARIAGFRCEPQPTYAAQDEAVRVRNCAGTVLLVGLDVTTRTGDQVSGFSLEHSGSVVLQDVTALGRYRGQQPGGPGLVVLRSHGTALRCTLTGGEGGIYGAGFYGEDGGDGVHVVDGTLLATACTLTGGEGAHGYWGSGDGGDGAKVSVVSGAAMATLLACDVARGLGVAGESADGDAVSGPARVATDCTIVGPLTNGAMTTPAKTLLDAPAAVVLGTSLTLTLTGSVGTFVLLGVDGRGELRFAPGFAEPLLLTTTWQPLASGLLPATTTGLSWPVPYVPQLDQLSLWFQAVAFEPSGRATLTPAVVTGLTQ